MIGAQTIGNATIVGYDKNPILATDPWLGSDHYAYFGSWYLPYEIPEKISQDILSSKYIFFSHGHPDHLNPDSIHKFKNNTIILGDHVGKRMFNDLKSQGFNVRILKERVWNDLSKNIAVMPVSTKIQDNQQRLDDALSKFQQEKKEEAIKCKVEFQRRLKKFENNKHKMLLTFDDGLIRGGALSSTSRAFIDTARIGGWLLSPEGILWGGRQTLLQRTNKFGKIWTPLSLLTAVGAQHLGIKPDRPGVVPFGDETFKYKIPIIDAYRDKLKLIFISL